MDARMCMRPLDAYFPLARPWTPESSKSQTVDEQNPAPPINLPLPLRGLILKGKRCVREVVDDFDFLTQSKKLSRISQYYSWVGGREGVQMVQDFAHQPSAKVVQMNAPPPILGICLDPPTELAQDFGPQVWLPMG